MFGDGREERMAAFDLEMKLRSNPEVTKRREEYYLRVELCRQEAERIGKTAVIERLVSNNPSYIRHLLETEDDRFGVGALNDRYAQTFYAKI